MRKLARSLAAAATAATLGFGAAQALAAPRAPDAERACSSGQCRKDCIAQGNSGGTCVGGTCACFIE